jgi:hypothetical protein
MKRIIDFGTYISEQAKVPSIAFHHSDATIPVGAYLNNREDSHYNVAEYLLESYRNEHCPEKPSRITGVFATPTKESLYSNKKHLYLVEVEGAVHITGAEIIGDINDYCVDLGWYFRYPEEKDYDREGVTKLGEECWEKLKANKDEPPGPYPKSIPREVSLWSAIEQYWKGEDITQMPKWGKANSGWLLEILADKMKVVKVMK